MDFFVMGLPKPQARPRAFKRGNHAAVYSPVTEWRNDVKYAAAQQEPIKGAVKVQIHYYFHRPKSDYGTGRNSDKIKNSAPQQMIKRPDLDNLNKAVLDALQDGGILADDSAVVQLESMKRYVGRDNKQGATIVILSID